MKSIAVILALAFPLTAGMALTAAFAFDLLPLLSTDTCFIAKGGTAQLTHFVAVLPSHFHRRIATNMAKLPELLNKNSAN
ncbi:MAG: hypothetical protein WA728_34830 [Xanthobacteraceae bacterium]